MITKPMPLSAGIAFRNAVATSSPPADMPMPTIGNCPPTPSAASLPSDLGADRWGEGDLPLASRFCKVGSGSVGSCFKLSRYLLPHSYLYL